MQHLKPFLAVVICLNLLCARADKADSLLSLAKTGSLKEKTDALSELCLLYCYNDPGKAKSFAFAAIKTASGEEYLQGLGKAYNRLGIVYDVSGNYDSATICYNQALEKYKQCNNPKGTGSAYNNLGLINWKRGKLNEAVNYFFKALPFFEEIRDLGYLANVYNNISLVNEQTGDSRKAVSYALKALNYYKTLNDQENIGGCYTNLCVSYQSFRMDSSEYYALEAIKCHEKNNNIYGLSIAYNDYGVVMNLTHNYARAHEYYLKSLKLKEELNEEEGIASLYVNISDNYRNMNDSKNALMYLLKAKSLSEKNNLLAKQRKIYEYLAINYKDKGMMDSAYIYMNLSNAAKDSIFTRELRNSLTDAQTRYETKEKELKIKEQEYQLVRKNNYIILLAGILFITALLFYLIATRYKHRQQLRLQNEIIRQQDIASKAVILAEENERRRVASDLHDSVGQMLSAIKLNLSAVSPFIVKEKALHFDKVMAMVDESCREVRAISHNLMPNSLLKSGLVSAVKEFIEQLGAETLRIRLETTGLNERLDNNTEVVLYRVIQESVNNVIKHAHASSLDIQITKDEEGISITIEDNGRGFDTNTVSDGIGLKNLRSRIGFLKGSLDISSSPGKGTLLAIFIPGTV